MSQTGYEHGKEPLPVVAYSIVDPSALIPAEVSDRSVESYGFNRGGVAWDEIMINDNDGRYLRWLQPMESELAKQVEYDMDEQDQLWLEAINEERRKDGIPPVSYEVFEIIIDKLEKDWFDLSKSIPKKASAMPNEDSRCAICDDGECENSNAIVFCDGCNLAVHQDCYGVPYIPEGQWLCRKCTVSPDKPVTCVLCPNSYGAFKQTTTNQWAHLLCAIWIPDTGVSNTVYMEPIDGVENISKSRWKLNCYLCHKRVGACIQCANRNCFQAFHVTCAREAGLEIKMKQGGERGELKAYCDKHSENVEISSMGSLSGSLASKPTPKGGALPSATRKHKTHASPSTTGRILTIKLSSNKSNKSARAYKQTYSTGPPLVPNYIFSKLVEYLGKLKIAKKGIFIGMVCKYWSLKRESRRGAPLLKRLHLEPWTASATSRHQTDVEKAKKLELIRLLRNDLEKVRMLTERVRKREKKKLERVHLFKEVVDKFVFPKERVFKDVLSRIASFDKLHIFAQPVSKIQVPDYYDIIKQPMDWATMGEKLDRHEYLTATAFQNDIELVLSNARKYNKSDTPVHKAAIRVGLAAEPILAELINLDQKELTELKFLPEVLSIEEIENLFEFDYDPNIEGGMDLDPINEQEEEEIDQEMKSGSKKESKIDRRRGKRKAYASLQNEDGVIRGRGRPSFATIAARSPAKVPLTEEVKVTEDVVMVDSPSIQKIRTSTRGKESIDAAATAAIAAAAELTLAKEAEEIAETEALLLATTTTATTTTSTSTTKRRIEPVAVEEVDSRSSFDLFESGWTLPPGSSRRGSKPESITTSPNLNPIASTSQVSPPSLIIKLPSPTATRTPRSRKGKEKAIEEDLEEDAADAAAVEASILPNRSNTLIVDSIPVVVPEEGEKVGTKVSTTTLSFTQQKINWTNRLRELYPLVEVDDKVELEEGTLVWNKFHGTIFPAEVIDPKSKRATRALLDVKPTAEGTDKHILVLFFDNTRSGCWSARKDLQLLGVNDEVDQLLLSDVSQKSRTGNRGKVEEIRQGYARAKGT